MNISLAAITELRTKTGAGLLVTKNALVEANGDMEAALVILRKQGIGLVTNRQGKATNEGLVHSYIHDGRIGVLIEVGCETDFVARNDDFKSFVQDLCLHIAALNPVSISKDEVPERLIELERTIASNGLEKKPEAIREKIVSGRLEKFFSENCLLNQQFVKDSGKTIQQLVNEQIVKTKENIRVKRFIRYSLGG